MSRQVWFLCLILIFHGSSRERQAPQESPSRGGQSVFILQVCRVSCRSAYRLCFHFALSCFSVFHQWTLSGWLPLTFTLFSPALSLSLYEIKYERRNRISGQRADSESHLAKHTENLRGGFSTSHFAETDMIWYEILHTLTRNILCAFITLRVCKMNLPHCCSPLSFRQPCESNVTQAGTGWSSIPFVKCIIFLLF
jgi:hypothetical protein